ncbi:MAG: Holliday junction branch migration protein RuvA [Parcubacteria group bacterium]
MIGYLSGKVVALSDNYVIVDVSGVGYRVVIPEKMHSSVSKIGLEIKLFTHFVLNPRDGSTELYGFATIEELRFFELLKTVSGVGPKSAQSILSKADLQSLQTGIVKEDAKYLSQVAGVGPKTAQRLILDLKNKMMKAGIASSKDGEGIDLTSEGEAMDALVTLGYSQYQAKEALKEVSTDIKTTEEKITEALKIMGKNK